MSDECHGQAFVLRFMADCRAQDPFQSFVTLLELRRDEVLPERPMAVKGSQRSQTAGHGALCDLCSDVAGTLEVSRGQ